MKHNENNTLDEMQDQKMLKMEEHPILRHKSLLHPQESY